VLEQIVMPLHQSLVVQSEMEIVIPKDQVHLTERKMKKEKIGMNSRQKLNEVSWYRLSVIRQADSIADERRKEGGGDDSDDGGKKKKRR
jgi:hypothetical protein